MLRDGSGSPSDSSKLTTLLIKDIPAELNTRDALLNHFSQFGEITRVQCRPNSTAIVYFKEHGDALAAKNRGKKISPRFRPVGIQWCKMERQSSIEGTSPTKSRLTRDASMNPFQTTSLNRDNQFQVKKSILPTPKSPSEATTCTDSVLTTLAISSTSSTGAEKQTILGSAKKLFGKGPLDDKSVQISTGLFGKPLPNTTLPVRDPSNGTEQNSIRGSPFATLINNPFAKASETAQGSLISSSGGTFALKESPKASPATLLPPVSASPLFKLDSLFGKPGPEKKTRDPATSNLAATAENRTDGFSALTGSSAESSIGKSTSATNIATTSAQAPMNLFGKPTPSSVVVNSELVSNTSSLAKPSMLFGKPVTEDLSQKLNATVEAKSAVVDKPPQDGGSFGAGFKPRGTVFGLPPFSALRWSADGASKDTSKATFGLKQDTLRPRTNLVWTKDKTTDPTTRNSLTAPKKSTDSPPFATELRESSAVASAAPKQLGSITRSDARSASPSRFSELFVHAAHSIADRYKLLEMRDKIIREQMSAEIQKGPVKGTCTDMCPEKERYQRSQRNLVEKFEMIPGVEGVMDPCRMVKEYQRSSADQEFPLPHELRPPPILEMTMNYLIREIIANQPKRGLGDWFTFVWNRTRAIRKDITQQKVEANPISALILERCARFHIHCGHSLCEEDSHDFDSKLNNENLTKCLKSLKYSYTDLKVQNVRCPNEAEFLAYEILLNLKEGFITKMINDLEPELRQDPLVLLSISAMNAIEFGNYRRFFKIVRKAPYLVACILHRYFTEVRRHAVCVLSKSLGSKGGNIALSTFTAELFFNNDDECSCFLATLNIEPDESGFINCKSMVDNRDLRFDISRSTYIIGKMGSSLAQVVYGPGTIPVDNYSPEDSFTTDGMFKKSALGLPEDYKIKRPPQTALSSILHHQAEPPKRRELKDEDILPSLMSVIEYVQHEQVNAICREVAAEQSVSLMSLERIIKQVLVKETREVADEILEQEKTADTMRRRALLSKITHDLSNELIMIYPSELLREICAEVLTEVSIEVVNELVNRNQQRILSDFLADIVPEIAKIEYDSQIEEYNTQLAKNFRSRALCKRSIKKWRKWVWLQKEIRDFPAAPNLGPIKRYPVTGRSYAEIRAEQVKLNAVRLLVGITERADTLPLNLPHIFHKKVRILVIGEVASVIMNKVKKLLSVDCTVSYQPDAPDSVQGFNVIIVLSNGSPSKINSVVEAAQRLKPQPAVGILWCGHPLFLALDVEEELLQREQEPLCIPLCNLLKKLSQRLPEEVKLQRASLFGFVTRGMEFCLHKLSTPSSHLPASVRLYNAIITHLAAVATSSTLLQINSLDDEIGWNEKGYLFTLYKHIKNLELPVPECNDRTSFIESIQRIKKISLLTTAVNMSDFKDDFVLLRDILARFSYSLNPDFKVRYLEDDLRNFEIPEFWYQRPLIQDSRSVTPLELSQSTDSDFEQDGEMEDYRNRVDNTIRNARELLRRSKLSYGRRIQEARDVRNLKRPIDNEELQSEVIRKRRSEGSHEESSSDISASNFNRLKRLSPGRLSKQTQIELDLFDMKQTIETLKRRSRIDKLLKDA